MVVRGVRMQHHAVAALESLPGETSRVTVSARRGPLRPPTTLMVSGVTPSALSRYFSTFKVGVFGNLETMRTYDGTAKSGSSATQCSTRSIAVGAGSPATATAPIHYSP